MHPVDAGHLVVGVLILKVKRSELILCRGDFLVQGTVCCAGRQSLARSSVKDIKQRLQTLIWLHKPWCRRPLSCPCRREARWRHRGTTLCRQQIVESLETLASLEISAQCSQYSGCEGVWAWRCFHCAYTKTEDWLGQGRKWVPYDISRQRIFWAGYKAELGWVNTWQNSLALEGPFQWPWHINLTFDLHWFQICNELCQKLNKSRDIWVFCFLSLTLFSPLSQLEFLKSQKITSAGYLFQ